MNTRCPACGACASLDVLIANQDAADALKTAYELSDGLGRALIRYLALFRSDTRSLSWERTHKLTRELLPDILRGQITRDRAPHPAPQAAWIWAMEQVVEGSKRGKPQRPLKSHGYLYEVLTSYKADPQSQPASPSTPTQPKPLVGDLRPRWEQT